MRTRKQPAKTKFPELVFSGMQPTHALHRGNYGPVRYQEAACGQRLELAGLCLSADLPAVDPQSAVGQIKEGGLWVASDACVGDITPRQAATFNGLAYSAKSKDGNWPNASSTNISLPYSRKAGYAATALVECWT